MTHENPDIVPGGDRVAFAPSSSGCCNDEKPAATKPPTLYLSKKVVRQVSHRRTFLSFFDIEFKQVNESASPSLTFLTVFDGKAA